MFRGLLILVWLICVGQSQAQIQPRTLTFTPRPYLQTKSFLLTEIGVYRRIGSHTDGRYTISESGLLVGWELGYMRNLSERWSLGGAAFLYVDDDCGLAGFKPRLRYWLGPESSFDLAIGPILTTFDSKRLNDVGFAGHIGLNANSFWSFTLGMDIIKYDWTVKYYNQPVPTRYRGTRPSYFLGMRVGGVPGAVIGVATPVAVVIFALLVMPRDADF